MNLPLEDTIAAIATAPGQGAIGIIRLSGPQALTLLTKIWKGSTPVSGFEASCIYLGSFIHPDTQQPIDQVMALSFKGPHSYTGEDIVEIHAHGGQHLLDTLLSQLLKVGARAAEPGEFTKRAFLNGKMDLIQAESVADLIAASSELSAQMAEKHLQGQLSEQIRKMRNDLKVMRAQMEAMIDFPEDEDVQGLYYEEILDRVNRISVQITKLLSSYEEGRRMREGIRVAIIGKPNVGKSSLFNALLQEDRAIVHPTPGTTRDLIEESLDLKGLRVRFIDTAGIREISESVESEGIRRTQEKLKTADLILVILDSSRPLDDQDQKVFDILPASSVTFLVTNKSDLPSRIDLKPSLGTPFAISAKEGVGISELKKKIFEHFVQDKKGSQEGIVLTNVRHRNALEKALVALQKVKEASEQKLSLEFLVSDLTVVTDLLGEITGEITNDEILGEIFSKFCIGK